MWAGSTHILSLLLRTAPSGHLSLQACHDTSDMSVTHRLLAYIIVPFIPTPGRQQAIRAKRGITSYVVYGDVFSAVP